MDNNGISHILDFIDDIVREDAKQQASEINFVMELAVEVKRCIEQNRHLLPYHLNIIDELHINENGHSRILCKLLQYKSLSGEYVVLQSLLRYIAEQNNEYHSIYIKSPLITQEQCRIDLWVRDRVGGYAIIFENKVYNATDQAAQLSRYIDCTKANGFTDEQIFVVYLSQQGTEPAEQSWGTYKPEYEQRYMNLSFKDDVLPWLKERIVPILPDKDYILRCAVEQYIDYLEGIFGLRTIDKELNMKVEECIKEKLGLTGQMYDDYRTIRQYQDDINKVLNHLGALKDKVEKQMFKEWKEAMIQHYPKLKDNITLGNRGKDIFVGINLEVCKHPISICIERETNIFYGVYCADGKDANINNMIEEATSYIGGWENNSSSWYCWRYPDSKSVLPDLIALIDAIMPLTKQ
ncbi:MAG: PD-(D/E)XK nuclease family protein [Bacteroidaceae bacterium]|nr:PD-(D/E)XK nuclease family protein [Bacteroidaceae bacterium]